MNKGLLDLLTSLSNVKFKRIFKQEPGQKGQFAINKRILKWCRFGIRCMLLHGRQVKLRQKRLICTVIESDAYVIVENYY